MSLAPDRERADGRHRIRRLGGAATAVTATIAAGSLALAAYTATSTANAPADAASASVGETEPVLASEPVALLDAETGVKAGQAYAEARELRAQQGAEALALSADLTSTGVSAVRDASEAISAQKKAEREAAAQAEREAAERAAAEQAAAERAEQEQAAAEQAEREAAEREQAETASRSTERQAAPAPQPAPAQQSAPAQQPAPAPAPAPVSSGDSRSIARSMLSGFGWGDDQWGCLDSLWMRESGWSHTATNASSGAYGIPQSLPAGKMASAGADWQTNPATQIKWGLTYISGRYGSPCGAWAHSEANNWY